MKTAQSIYKTVVAQFTLFISTSIRLLKLNLTVISHLSVNVELTNDR